MSELASGIVTFLFTDVEGSTRLLREVGRERYAQLLADHQRVLRTASAKHRGEELDTQGDAFFVAFQTASDALGAAVEAQRALTADAALPRVRMGLHTGEASRANGRYVGVAVHRAARICAAAQGGQVLVSNATRELVEDELPEGVALRDLGEQRLKDVERPARLFQLQIEGLPPAAPLATPALRVVIADDETLLREGLARLLADAGFEVVGKAATADELLRRVQLTRPDVAIVDIRMPPTHTDEGLVAAQEIRRRQPGVGVLVLSHHVESRYAMRLVEDHPERSGYLLKERVSDLAVLVDALRRIGEGECVIDPTIVSRLLRRPRDGSALDELTERELEVLGLMAEGHSNQGICNKLFLSPKTVETHVRHILLKLGIAGMPEQHRRVLAVLAYLRR